MTDEEKTNNEKQPQKRGKRRPRAHGTGSVFQRKDRKGKQWVAQLVLENGKTKQSYHNTQGEAATALNEMLYEQRHGTLVTEKDQTVKQQLEHWIENVHKHSVRISTYAEYRRIIDKYIIPGLGHYKLQRLTTHQVEVFYTQRIDEGLSANYVKIMHAILHQALDHAVRNNLVIRNVCDSAKLPRIPRHEIQALTQEQAQQLLEEAKGHTLEALLTLAVVTGMREGELLALRWSDIDLEKGYLQIRRTVRRVFQRGLIESEPKTASSRRKIVLSPFLVEVLKQHRIRQLEARLQAGSAWKENNIVFCNPYGEFRDPAAVIKAFKKLLVDAGLPVMRFHDLRHSAATLLLTMGVHAKVVQELLGHSSISITLNIYSHVLPSLQKDAVDKMSDLFHNQDNQESRGINSKNS